MAIWWLQNDTSNYPDVDINVDNQNMYTPPVTGYPSLRAIDGVEKLAVKWKNIILTVELMYIYGKWTGLAKDTFLQ